MKKVCSRQYAVGSKVIKVVILLLTVYCLLPTDSHAETIDTLTVKIEK